jgi:YspA, cpYpsA-related SLOG family
MRLLVCGSRTWTDRARLWQALDQLVSQHGYGQVVLIEGDARGADRLAGQLARERGWALERYPADWTRQGRAAGFRRNARMLRQGHPDLVVAFTVGPLQESRGTADMVRRAREAGVPVHLITTDHA